MRLRATTPRIDQYEDNRTPRPDLRHNDACSLVHIHNRWQCGPETTHNAFRHHASQSPSRAFIIGEDSEANHGYMSWQLMEFSYSQPGDGSRTRRRRICSRAILARNQ